MVKVLRKSDLVYLSGRARFFHNEAIVLLIVGSIIMFAVPYVGFLLGLVILTLATAYWKQYTDYDTGIQGEQLVSQTLKELDEEYYLLEDVNLLSVKGNIDHVLVGPNGIFAIEAKNYSGKVSCHKDMWYHTKRSGMHKTEIQSVSIQVKKNAANLNRTLTNFLGTQFTNRLFVEPVVVFTDDKMELKTKEPTVLVARVDSLLDILQRHRMQYHYSTNQVDTIAQAVPGACGGR